MVVVLFGKIPTPFLSGEVAVGDPAGDALPGFEIDVPKHHAAFFVFIVCDRECFIVSAEGNAIDFTLLNRESILQPPFTFHHVPEHYATLVEGFVTGGEHFAIMAEGDTLDSSFWYRGV